MTLKYNELVIEHFKNPRNVGELKDSDAVATEGSLACGDMMTLYIKVKDNVIVDITFQSYGCAANIATGSMLTEIIKGKTVEEAKTLEWKDIVEALGGLPNIKYHCSNLAVETLRKAIENWERRQRGEPMLDGPSDSDSCKTCESEECQVPGKPENSE